MLKDPKIMDGLKYILAVEDFKVFTTFMEDMNILLNEQSAMRIAKQQRKRLMAETPDMELALQMSLAEEEERKNAILDLERQEEEQLRLALEESLKLS